MKKIILIIITSLTVLSSCKKEKFPDMNELKGSWIEQTNKSFKHTLIFEDAVLFFVKPSKTDTLIYNLDKENEVLSLKLVNSPSDITGEHKILINKRKKELTIWGLFIGINTSETTFKKE
jgi:hypothetical protein